MSSRFSLSRACLALVCLALPAVFACNDEGEEPSARLSFVDRSSSFLPDDRGQNALTLEVGDLDGNGRTDLIVGYQRGLAVWTRSSEDSRFVLDASIALPSTTAGFVEIRLADVDRDGDLDLILATLAEGVRLWIQRSSRSFVDETFERLPASVGIGSGSAVETSDFDGDGAVDLFVSDGSGTHVLLNRGNGSFREPAGQRLPSALAGQTTTRDALFADLNGDSAVDLVVDVGGQPELLQGRADGSFRVGTTRFPGTGLGRLTRLALIDLEGDGDQDVAAVSDERASEVESLVLLRNDGPAQFRDVGSELLSQDGGPAFDVQSADLDADGDEDLIFATETEGVEIFLNEEEGRFQDRSSRLPGLGSTLRVRTLDVDSDGDLDILTVRTGERTTLLMNRLDPGATPTASPTPTEGATPAPTAAPTASPTP